MSAKKRACEFFYNSDIDSNGCWIWRGSKNVDGYGRTCFRGERSASCHRISWKLYWGDIPPKTMVLHKCDVRACMNPHHLFLGNQDANMKDAAAKGRMSKIPRFIGEDHPNAKLNSRIVKEIRSLFAGGKRQFKIAKMMGVSTKQVHLVVNRKSWGHI